MICYQVLTVYAALHFLYKFLLNFHLLKLLVSVILSFYSAINILY